MDSQQKVNCKRCIQVLLPTVPAPLVDYALNSSFIANIASGTNQVKQSDDDVPGRVSFALRAMDSGDFGELSLSSPTLGGRHYLKNNTFGDREQLCFSFDLPSASPPRSTAASGMLPRGPAWSAVTRPHAEQGKGPGIHALQYVMYPE